MHNHADSIGFRCSACKTSGSRLLGKNHINDKVDLQLTSIWCPGSVSSLVQVLADCVMAPSLYLKLGRDADDVTIHQAPPPPPPPPPKKKKKKKKLKIEFGDFQVALREITDWISCYPLVILCCPGQSSLRSDFSLLLTCCPVLQSKSLQLLWRSDTRNLPVFNLQRRCRDST